MFACYYGVTALIIRNKTLMKRRSVKIRNLLWLSRKHLGLRQKQVAYLLKHKTTDQISRYEKGERAPSLKALLELEIVYGLPPRILYQPYYEQLREEISERIKGAQGLQGIDFPLEPQPESLAEFCSYANLLRVSHLSAADQAKIRRHVIQIMRQLANR